MVSPVAMSKTGTNLLPIFSPGTRPTPTGVTYRTPLNAAQLRTRMTQRLEGEFGPDDRAAMLAPLDEIVGEQDPCRKKLLIAHQLGFWQQGRMVFWENDLSHPGKRVLFKSEVERNAAWIFEQGKLEMARRRVEAERLSADLIAGEPTDISAAGLAWTRSLMPDTLAHREWNRAMENWFAAAAVSPSALEMLGELTAHPEFGAHIMTNLRARAENGNGDAYSALFSLVGQGVSGALDHTRHIILAQRMNIDTSRLFWKDHLGLVLFFDHYAHESNPVTLLDEDDLDEDNPYSSIVPVSVAKQLVRGTPELKGMTDAVHEVLGQVEEYFKFAESDAHRPEHRERIIGIIQKLAGAHRKKNHDLSPLGDTSFLRSDLNAPVSTLLRSIAYLAQHNSAYYAILETFAEDGIWGFFADDILEQLEHNADDA